MTARFRDLDAFLNEIKKEPIEIVVFGKKHKLPAALPAYIMMDILRIQAENGGELPSHEILNLADKFFGREVMEGWLKKDDFSMELLAELIRWTIAEYSGGEVPVTSRTPKVKVDNP